MVVRGMRQGCQRKLARCGVVSVRKAETGMVGVDPLPMRRVRNGQPRGCSAKHTHRPYSHFLATALAADLVTFEPASFFVTLLMMPTATVWRMSRTAKRPSGG
jgi:hypothetical protein